MSTLFYVTIFLYLCSVESKHSVPRNETFKHQFCTDPRTQQRHGAYTEWSDAYSCSRHRCRPGARRLAIYTVGCKAVEPPESAIECEQVVEDTNMQFPFCCIRLRCLVVVRGEVWTKVLGQPWETLPAAPWSHMYKMKRAPPEDPSLKADVEGPVYELSEVADNGDGDAAPRAVMRSERVSSTTANPDCDQPDIVIAVQATDAKDNHLKKSHKRYELRSNKKDSMEADAEALEDFSADEPTHYERRKHQMSLTTPKQKVRAQPATFGSRDDPGRGQKEVSKPTAFYASKYDHTIATFQAQDADAEYHEIPSRDPDAYALRNGHAGSDAAEDRERSRRPKRPNRDQDYTRFNAKRGSGKGSSRREQHDLTSELPLFVEDTDLSGYFSDDGGASARKRTAPGKERSNQIFVAPVEPQRSNTEKKRHKKKRHHHHSKKRTLSSESRRRRINRLNSLEMDFGSLDNGSDTSQGYK